MAEVLLLVCYFAVELPQEALVVDTHCFEEIHLKLLTISAELCCQPVSLGLQLFLCDFLHFKALKLVFQFNYLFVAVLVLTNHVLDVDLVLWNKALDLVSFCLSLPAVTLEGIRGKDYVFVVSIFLLRACSKSIFLSIT